MFNLPFPTDSLYKFCFMFGLFLIVFAFYFKEKQLNKFDKKQIIYKLDSLNTLKRTIDYRMNIDTAKVNSAKKDIEDSAFRINSLQLMKSFTNNLKNYHFNKNDTLISNLYLQIMKIDSNKFSTNDLYLFTRYTDRLITVLRDYQNQVNEEINYFDLQLKENQFDFKLLLSIGIILFLPGIFLWYFKIQKPQDELLQMQLIEMKSNKLIKPTGRKHHDPIYNKKNF